VELAGSGIEMMLRRENNRIQQMQEGPQASPLQTKMASKKCLCATKPVKTRGLFVATRTRSTLLTLQDSLNGRYVSVFF
jgi:hypothetical protein